jgi:hypothetical protein
VKTSFRGREASELFIVDQSRPERRPRQKPRLLDAMRRALTGVKSLKTSELHPWLSSFPPQTFEPFRDHERIRHRIFRGSCRLENPRETITKFFPVPVRSQSPGLAELRFCGPGPARPHLLAGYCVVISSRGPLALLKTQGLENE